MPRALRTSPSSAVRALVAVGLRSLPALPALVASACTPDSIAPPAEPEPEPAVVASRSAIVINPAVAISQVYGGGGNASAPFLNDFVELFNRSSGPVVLDGWSVQYTSANGPGLFSGAVTPISGTLAAGHYYLVRMASGGGTGAPLPAADAIGSTAMSLSAGKVVLVSSAAGLACNGGSTACSAGDSALIVDLVGYGGANFFEGSGATGTLGNTTAALRAGGGCTDSNNNAGDFTVGAPSPRNTATAANVCSGGGDQAPAVQATTPVAGASNVDPGTLVTITFSEPVTVSGSWFTFSCGVSGTVAAAVSGGPTSFVLTPPAPLAPGESCQVTVLAAAVSDVDAVDPPDTMVANFVFGFSVASGTTVPIHNVQGAAHTSPLVGQVLDVGPAVVTVLASNGFYMQDPTPDADDATSEGLFVFTSSAPAVALGDEVVVHGTVAEFRPGCSGCTPGDSAYSNLTSTEIDGPTVTLRGHGRPLPPAIVLGTGVGERRQPTAIIEDDASGNVETSGAFDPATDGIDFLESLEGMRVRIDTPVVVDPTRTFSASSVEIGVLTRGGADAGLRTPRGGIVLTPGDFNPERLFLANALTPSFPIVNVGDSFAGTVVGVVSYSFANYKVLVSEPLPAVTSGGLTPEVTSLVPATPSQLTVASINVENLDPTDPQSKFNRLAAIVVQNLRAPDMLAVEEVQDNNGPTDDGVVDATTTLDMFVGAITTSGGPSYSYRQISPQNDQDGGEPGGNIRVAILYRADRGLAFVDRPGAGATTANDITTSGGLPHLTFSPGRLDPTNTAFTTSRKPLAAELTFQGQTLFVIANHFNSKGGDQPLFGRFQPPVLASETQRLAQAAVVSSFVVRLLSANAGARIVVLGDLNDFSFAPPLGVLKGAGLTDLIESLPPSERYTYVFEGNSQVLDHIMVSASLAPHAVFDVLHVNAEFSDQASDHEPGLARLDLAVTPVPALPVSGVLMLVAALALAGPLLIRRWLVRGRP
jgi:predicted extracellular nuclease